MTPLPRREVSQVSRSRGRGIGAARRDDLDQVHVARRIEEVDAAETRTHRFGQPSASELIDRPEVLEATTALTPRCGAIFA